MLIFHQKINMDDHADFFIKNLTLMALLIFLQKINIEGNADFFSKN